MSQDYGVLVVDDDPVFLEQMHSVLKKHGYKVHTAQNGEDALRIMEQGICHMLVTDLFLPMMNGIELSKKAYQKMPVVVVAKEDESGSFDVNIAHYSHCFLDKSKIKGHLVRACQKAQERYFSGQNKLLSA